MRVRRCSVLVLVTGCSAINPAYDPAGATAGEGTADSGASLGGATMVSDSVGATSEAITSDGSGTDSGPPVTEGSGSESSGDQPDCEGLFHVQLSESTKPQVPRPVTTGAGPMVFFVDSNLAAGAALSVARFFDGLMPGVEELSSPWTVDRSFIMAAGPGGFAAVLDSPPVLLSVEPNLQIVDDRPISGLEDFTISGLVHMGDDWLIPTISGMDFGLLRYPDGANMNDVGFPDTGVAWVAGSGNEAGGVYLYRLSDGPTCFAWSAIPPEYPFGKVDLLTGGDCLAPTLAFENDVGGLAAYYRGEKGPSAIVGQRLGPTGLPLNPGGEFVIASGKDLHHPAVQRLPSGDYWVVWDDEGAMQAATLDGNDPAVLLHMSEHFAGPTTFRKRTFVAQGHPAVAFHLTTPDALDTGVHVVIDCDAN